MAAVGGSFADVLLPNLFGEHGRPAYNSFVATFAHAVAHGRSPTVTSDREVPLLHAQDAAEALDQAVLAPRRRQVRPEGEPRGCHRGARALLRAFTPLYAARGEIPDL